MDESAAYLIVILSPFLFLVSKLSIHYVIVFDLLRKRHSKTFINKHKGNFFQYYFLTKFKDEIGWWYVLNFALGILFWSGIVLSLVYLILWICGHKILFFIIPNIILYIDIVLSVFRLFRLVFEKIFGKRNS